MDSIRNLVINNITDILIIITSKERWRLTITIIIIIVVVTVRYLISKAQREIALVDELYGRENLAPNLGWKNLKYPIIWFDWDLAEPLQVVSRDDFKKDYAWWIWVKYVIDAELEKYNIQNVRLWDIWGTDPRIAKIKFPKVEDSQERVDFEEMKTQMIKKIKRDKMSCYVWLESEMELTKNIHELVQVMNKWEF